MSSFERWFEKNADAYTDRTAAEVVWKAAQRPAGEAELIANYPTWPVVIEVATDLPGAKYIAYWQGFPETALGGSTRQAALEYLEETAAESKRLEDEGTP